MIHALFVARFRFKALLPWLVISFVLGAAAAFMNTAPAIDYLQYPHEEMPELFTVFGFVGNNNLPLTVRSYLYGFLLPLLSALYAVSAARRLIALPQDDGRLANLTAAPVWKPAILLVLWLVAQASALLIMMFAFGGQALVAAWLFPGADYTALARLAIGFYPIFALAISVCFLLALLSTEEAVYLRRARLVLLLMLVLSMAARLPGWTRSLRLVSLWTLSDGRLAFNPNAWTGAIAAGILAVLCLLLSLAIFWRKEL